MNSTPICKNCKTKTCYFENGKYHDYCGRTCAKSHQSKAPKCKSGCGKDCYLENGKYHDYCGKTCRDSFKGSKSSAPKCKSGCGKDCFLENGKYHDYCGKTCRDKTSSQTNTTFLSKSDQKYQDLEHQFLSKWKKNGTPKVHAILSINLY